MIQIYFFIYVLIVVVVSFEDPCGQIEGSCTRLNDALGFRCREKKGKCEWKGSKKPNKAMKSYKKFKSKKDPCKMFSEKDECEDNNDDLCWNCAWNKKKEKCTWEGKKWKKELKKATKKCKKVPELDDFLSSDESEDSDDKTEKTETEKTESEETEETTEETTDETEEEETEECILVKSIENFIVEAKKIDDAGDCIELADGKYTNVRFSVTIDAGTQSNPVVLRAQSLGGVTITGKSTFEVKGIGAVLIEGFQFDDGEVDGSGYGAVMYVAGRGSTVRNVRISNYEGGRYLILDGKDTALEYNEFGPKDDEEPMVSVETKKNFEPGHIIFRNLFHSFTRGTKNGFEGLRIGWSGGGFQKTQCVVYENVFRDFEGTKGELEIVSVKGSDNILRGNVFLKCAGQLTLRHGDRNTVQDNFFLGKQQDGTSGARLIGHDHLVKNNLFKGLRDSGDLRYAIGLMSADEDGGGVTGYQPVYDVLIEDNTVDDCPQALMIGAEHGDDDRAPRDITLRNNDFGDGRIEIVSDAKRIVRLDGIGSNLKEEDSLPIIEIAGVQW